MMAESVDELLAVLAETPTRFASLSERCEAAQLTAKPEEGGWSATDILAHLRACADVWGESIQAMLAEDHPTLCYLSPRTYIRRTDYPDLDFYPSFDAFRGQRGQLLGLLQGMDSDGWQRGASFTGTTKDRVETVFSCTRRMALHERGHWEQVETLAK